MDCIRDLAIGFRHDLARKGNYKTVYIYLCCFVYYIYIVSYKIPNLIFSKLVITIAILSISNVICIFTYIPRIDLHFILYRSSMINYFDNYCVVMMNIIYMVVVYIALFIWYVHYPVVIHFFVNSTFHSTDNNINYEPLLNHTYLSRILNSTTIVIIVLVNLDSIFSPMFTSVILHSLSMTSFNHKGLNTPFNHQGLNLTFNHQGLNPCIEMHVLVNGRQQLSDQIDRPTYELDITLIKYVEIRILYIILLHSPILYSLFSSVLLSLKYLQFGTPVKENVLLIHIFLCVSSVMLHYLPPYALAIGYHPRANGLIACMTRLLMTSLCQPCILYIQYMYSIHSNYTFHRMIGLIMNNINTSSFLQEYLYTRLIYLYSLSYMKVDINNYFINCPISLLKQNANLYPISLCLCRGNFHRSPICVILKFNFVFAFLLRYTCTLKLTLVLADNSKTILVPSYTKPHIVCVLIGQYCIIVTLQGHVSSLVVLSCMLACMRAYNHESLHYMCLCVQRQHTHISMIWNLSSLCIFPISYMYTGGFHLSIYYYWYTLFNLQYGTMYIHVLICNPHIVYILFLYSVHKYCLNLSKHISITITCTYRVIIVEYCDITKTFFFSRSYIITERVHFRDMVLLYLISIHYFNNFIQFHCIYYVMFPIYCSLCFHPCGGKVGGGFMIYSNSYYPP